MVTSQLGEAEATTTADWAWCRSLGCSARWGHLLPKSELDDLFQSCLAATYFHLLPIKDRVDKDFAGGQRNWPWNCAAPAVQPGRRQERYARQGSLGKGVIWKGMPACPVAICLPALQAWYARPWESLRLPAIFRQCGTNRDLD